MMDGLISGLNLEDGHAIVAFVARHPDCTAKDLVAGLGPAHLDYADRLAKLVRYGWLNRRTEGFNMECFYRGRWQKRGKWRYRYSVRPEALHAIRSFVAELEPMESVR